jgi:hypothetical protein
MSSSEDAYDRQKCVPNWNDDWISHQRVLLLGAGSIGCSTAISLARIGVAQLVILDNDKVETSNLNRQLLFSRKHVGQYKSLAAQQTLDEYHVPDPTRTRVFGEVCNVAEQWSRVVEFAKRSTVVFNAVDIGQEFDYAVLALCELLEIPYISASSYCRTITIEFCAQGGDSLSRVPGSIAHLEGNVLLACERLNVRHDLANSRQFGSHVMLCGNAGFLAVNAWIQHFQGFPQPNFIKLDVSLYWQGGQDLIYFPSSSSSS